MPGLGELFAPAYTKGDPASETAVQSWMDRNFSMTNPKVEQTRQPVAFNTGNPAGMVDPEALRALAQGGPYDMNARRNAIAAQVQANAAAAAQAAPTAQAMNGGAGRLTPVGNGVYLPEFDTSQQYSPYQNDPRFAAVQGYGGGGVGGSS